MNDGKVVDRLEVLIGISGKPRRLKDAIELVFQGAGFSELDSTSRAHRRITAIKTIIEARRRSADDLGIVSTLDLFGSTFSQVGGSSFALKTDDQSTKNIKKGRAVHEAILREIQKLSALEFEEFGAALIQSFGAKRSLNTQASGDQGIDFIGTMKLSDLLDHPKRFFKLASDVKIDFLGQAKHYPKNKLGPSTVREMVGSLELARSKNFSSAKFNSLDDLALTSFGPVLAMLISTGSVTEGARKVAKAAGVMLKSGDQLATYLADLGVGLNSSGKFSAELFRDWVKRT